MRIASVVAFALSVASTHAQDFSVSVDSNRMLIGDVRTLSLMVGPISGAQPDSLDLGPWIEQEVEPLQMGDWQLTGNQWTSELRFMVFDTGYIVLPPLALALQGSDEVLYSNDLALEVFGVTVDSTGLAPLRDIRRERLNFGDVLPYLVGVLLLAALAVLWYFYNLRQEQQEEVVIVVPDPPHEVALRRLSELDAKKLWQAGKIKEYQSELTHIMRWYLEEKFRIPALESTTTEIVRFLSNSAVPLAEVAVVQEVLNMADLVKFAKAKPAANIHQEFMVKAQDFVRKTRQYQTENSSEEE